MIEDILMFGGTLSVGLWPVWADFYPQSPTLGHEEERPWPLSLSVMLSAPGATLLPLFLMLSIFCSITVPSLSLLRTLNLVTVVLSVSDSCLVPANSIVCLVVLVVST